MSIEKERILKLVNGNIGALSFLDKLIDFLTNSTIETLEKMGITGSELYMLWNDCCDRDFTKVQEVINKFSNGEFTKEYIQKHIKNLGRGKKFEELEEE